MTLNIQRTQRSETSWCSFLWILWFCQFHLGSSIFSKWSTQCISVWMKVCACVHLARSWRSPRSPVFMFRTVTLCWSQRTETFEGRALSQRRGVDKLPVLSMTSWPLNISLLLHIHRLITAEHSAHYGFIQSEARRLSKEEEEITAVDTKVISVSLGFIIKLTSVTAAHCSEISLVRFMLYSSIFSLFIIIKFIDVSKSNFSGKKCDA